MSDNHDLLNDNEMCSFSGHEAEDMCFNYGDHARGDGVPDGEETLSLCGLAGFFREYVPVFLAGKMYIESRNLRGVQKFVET